jgi:hypothetical protein
LVQSKRPKIYAGVVIELDLPSADTADYAPAVFARDIPQFIAGQSAHDPQLGRMGDEILWLDREHARNLLDHSRQLFRRGHWPVLRRLGGGLLGNFFPGTVGGSFAGRLSFDPSAA